MQRAPAYEDVVAEVRAFFLERIDACVKAGIRPERICLDPGIGFGKTAEHNVELLAAIPEFRALGRPVLIGHSRKQFIKRILGRPLDERLQGTVGVTLAVAHLGADVVRVHDVAANRDALHAYSTVVGRGRDRAAASGRDA